MDSAPADIGTTAESTFPPHIQRMRAFYAMEPGAPLVRREFGFYSEEAWREEGLEGPIWEAFDFDPPSQHPLGGLGWCEAALVPAFEPRVLEDRGEHELVRDHAGRHLLCFKGRRSGFMPEYLAHPVVDQRSWEEEVRWRLDPDSPERWQDFEQRMALAEERAAAGMMVVQNLIGGYMYLRSLMGPETLLYVFYDQPELVHACMRQWLELARGVIARHQERLAIDELSLAEDICYNHGPLVSPDMMRAFLLPYYQQLLAELRARQPGHHCFVHIDTDGYADPVIPVYRDELGMDRMSPFEVAAGCDVVALGEHFGDLRMSGGIDKRILAAGPAAIDRELERIIPPLRARGGFYPTCDHGVPAEVPLAHYRHYRRRCRELGG